MEEKQSFKILFISILGNILFILLFLRNIEDPIFIKGNLKILIFNIFLGLIFIIFRQLNKSRRISFFKLFKVNSYVIFSTIFIPMITNILFWSLGPTIIDRSLSVNVLGTLYLSEKPLSIDDLNWSLYTNYMNQSFQAQKRVEEQLYLGNIMESSNKKYVLTKKGLRTAKLNLFLTKFFNLDTSSSSPKKSPLERIK